MNVETTISTTIPTTWIMDIEPTVGTLFWFSKRYPSLIFMTPFFDGNNGIRVGPCTPGGDHVEIETMEIPCPTLTQEFWDNQSTDYNHPQWKEYFKIVEEWLPKIIEQLSEKLIEQL